MKHGLEKKFYMLLKGNCSQNSSLNRKIVCANQLWQTANPFMGSNQFLINTSASNGENFFFRVK